MYVFVALIMFDDTRSPFADPTAPKSVNPFEVSIGLLGPYFRYNA